MRLRIGGGGGGIGGDAGGRGAEGVVWWGWLEMLD